MQVEYLSQRYLVVLLASLIFILMFVPMFERSEFGITLLNVGLTAVLIASAATTRKKGLRLVVALLAVSIASPLTWFGMYQANPILFVVSAVFDCLFFFVITGYLLSAVLRKHLATVDSIYGAICGYLMIGLGWAMLYFALERLDPESLSNQNRITVVTGEIETTSFSQLVYFSFVTMSTLGYGDIYPQTPAARTLTWMQSVTGMFYVAVVVAWVVSEMPRRHRRGPPSDKAGP